MHSGLSPPCYNRSNRQKYPPRSFFSLEPSAFSTSSSGETNNKFLHLLLLRALGLLHLVIRQNRQKTFSQIVNFPPSLALCIRMVGIEQFSFWTNQFLWPNIASTISKASIFDKNETIEFLGGLFIFRGSWIIRYRGEQVLRLLLYSTIIHPSIVEGEQLQQATAVRKKTKK